MKKALPVLTLIALSTPSLVHAQAYDQRIIYTRATEPNGAVWLNDASGLDTLLFTDGNLAKVDKSGNFIIYMRNTSLSNPAYGGQWMRHDGSDNSDNVLYTNNADYIAGYDMLTSDSSFVMAYGCGIDHYTFSGTHTTNITNSSCYDDAPDIRFSDSLIVFHNSQANLFTVHWDGSQRFAIPNTVPNDQWPTWSPDGHWILFGRYTSASGGAINYYKIKEDGDSLTAITLNAPTDTAHYSTNAVWSMDGTAIIAAGYRSDGSYGLVSIADDGTGTEQAVYTAPGDHITFISGVQNAYDHTGIATVHAQQRLIPWPVPASTTVNFELPANTGKWTLQLFDAQGLLVIERSAPAGLCSIDLSTLADGLFHLRATTANGKVLTAPVVKM